MSGEFEDGPPTIPDGTNIPFDEDIEAELEEDGFEDAPVTKLENVDPADASACFGCRRPVVTMIEVPAPNSVPACEAVPSCFITVSGRVAICAATFKRRVRIRFDDVVEDDVFYFGPDRRSAHLPDPSFTGPERRRLHAPPKPHAE